jgi:hypothetical protein
VSATHGLISYDLNHGTFTRDGFAIFMDSFAEEVFTQHIRGVSFFLDNCDPQG